MNITLTPDVEQIVTDLVKKGSYPDPLTVIQAAVHRLNNEEEELELEWDPEDLRREIMRGIEDLQQGRKSVFNEAAVDRIIAEGKARRAAGGNGHD